MHIREIPFLRLLAPLCTGVIIAEVLPGFKYLAWIIAVSVFLVLTFFVLRKTYNAGKAYGLVLFMLLTVCGYILYDSAGGRLSILSQDRQILQIRLSEYPDKKSNSYSLRAVIESFSGCSTGCKPRGSILLYFMTDSTPPWEPGDKLLVHTSPLPVRNNGNPCEFNYRRYMEGQGVIYFGFFSKEDVIDYKAADHRTLREKSKIAAQRMTGIFSEAGLEGDDLGLVTALTIGEKDLLEKDLLALFSRTGAMHIMAVSGLHVGMISLCLSYMLFFLKRKLLIVKIAIVLIALWAFAFITGLSPSVLRATIMFSFLQAGILIKRPGNSMNLLLASAFILIIARPAVLFEAGFQLSYLAVGAILAFYEPLYKVIHFRNKIADYLWQMVAVSIVAQAGTMALTIRLFNIFPLMFLLTNIIVIPISFAVLILAFLLLVFSPIGPVSALITSILKFLSQTTIDFTTFAASLRHGVIENIGLSTVETILLILASALLLASLLRSARITLKPFLVVISLFIFSNILKNLSESRVEKDIRYNVKGREIVAHQSGRYIYLNTDEEVIPPEIKKHAATRGLTIKVRTNT